MIQGEGYAPVEESYSVPSEAIETPEPTLPEGDAVDSDLDKSAMISVNVPADAIVYINGYKTSSTGAQRRFLSAGLESDERYAYEVRAVLGDLRQTKVVTIRAGSRTNVVFDDLSDTDPMLTTLKLHVPTDARVTLAGQETSMSGSTRVFTTRRLDKGKKWNEYLVHVSVERDGEQMVRERTLTIRAGETHEMSFLVDETSIASLN